MKTSSFDSIKEAGVLSTAQHLGLRYLPYPAPGSLSPCPGCGAEQRSSGDKRGPIGLRRDDKGWVCHRCKASGDALSLVALVITGSTKPDKAGWQEVLEKFSGEVSLPLVIAKPRLPRRPAVEEIDSLWGRAGSVADNEEVSSLLQARGINPGAVADRDLCRAVPSNYLPAWASSKRMNWYQSGHKALFPLFDHCGQLQSLHGRRLAQDAPRPKGLLPVGYEVAGLVLADDSARQLLQGKASWVTQLLIVEGAPDFLCANLYFGEEATTAVIGIIAGSWTEEFSRRLPKNITVTIATHFDQAGEQYAQKIREALPAGMKLNRWRPQLITVSRTDVPGENNYPPD